MSEINNPMTAPDAPSPLLSIEGLSVAYKQEDTWLNAVRDFSLSLNSGQTYGLVGESGSGKTTVALALVRYLGESGRIQEGRIGFAGQDLLALDSSEMGRIWGGEIAFVPQDPLSSLNPSITIGEQLAEVLRHHQSTSRDEAREAALSLLESVRVPDPYRVAASYPHQLSGGMQQRVLIAMALSTEPKLLVLDEPTTALDVTTQAVILDLFRDLIRERETAALYVTHNLGVVAQICDRVAVLYAGELVEDAAIGDLFIQPLHPYTQSLMSAVPFPDPQKERHRKRIMLEGEVPSPANPPKGCVFHTRCPLAVDRCEEIVPEYREVRSNHFIACHLANDAGGSKISV